MLKNMLVWFFNCLSVCPSVPTFKILQNKTKFEFSQLFKKITLLQCSTVDSFITELFLLFVALVCFKTVKMLIWQCKNYMTSWIGGHHFQAWCPYVRTFIQNGENKENLIKFKWYFLTLTLWACLRLPVLIFFAYKLHNLKFIVNVVKCA